MRKLLVVSLLTTIGAAWLPTTALAWNKPGHMVVAAIAYRDLKQSGKQDVINKVIQKLKSHPDFDKMFKSRLSNVDPDDRDLYLFMLAARWSDDIRAVPNHPENDPRAHFIDNPFVPSFLSGIATAPPNPTDNLVVKFKASVKAIDEGSNGNAEANALTWLFHLAGDVHQPLHTVTMFTADFKPPEGDRGGNEVFIRVKDGSHTINLHAFWDGAITGSDKFQNIRNVSITLSSQPSKARGTFPQIGSNPSVDDWTGESFELAKSVAYRDGNIEGGTKNDGEVLPDDYVPEAKQTAEQQVVLAGYRLADLLVKLAPKFD